jgi:hypothetical protein
MDTRSERRTMKKLWNAIKTWWNRHFKGLRFGFWRVNTGVEKKVVEAFQLLHSDPLVMIKGFVNEGRPVKAQFRCRRYLLDQDETRVTKALAEIVISVGFLPWEPSKSKKRLDLLEEWKANKYFFNSKRGTTKFVIPFIINVNEEEVEDE